MGPWGHSAVVNDGIVGKFGLGSLLCLGFTPPPPHHQLHPQLHLYLQLVFKALLSLNDMLFRRLLVLILCLLSLQRVLVSQLQLAHALINTSHYPPIAISSADPAVPSIPLIVERFSPFHDQWVWRCES